MLPYRLFEVFRIAFGFHSPNHVDGQLARADYGNVGGNDGRARTPAAPPAGSEAFLWDGLALIKRGDERFVNEPHVGGGNPVVPSKGATYFNDVLGTTVGAKNGRKYSPAALTAFGETIENGSVRSTPTPTPSTYNSFFTGKPHVEGLGHAFLFRNYRTSLAKWQTADPLGYPDGWNQLAYCGNEVNRCVDWYGAACKCVVCNCGVWVYPSLFGDGKHYFMGRDGMPIFNSKDDIMNFMENYFPEAHYFAAVHDSWVDELVGGWGILVNIPSMPAAYVFGFLATSYDAFADFVNFLQNQLKMPNVKPIWLPYCACSE